jgi:hypothetical protein
MSERGDNLVCGEHATDQTNINSNISTNVNEKQTNINTPEHTPQSTPPDSPTIERRGSAPVLMKKYICWFCVMCLLCLFVSYFLLCYFVLFVCLFVFVLHLFMSFLLSFLVFFPFYREQDSPELQRRTHTVSLQSTNSLEDLLLQLNPGKTNIQTQRNEIS